MLRSLLALLLLAPLAAFAAGPYAGISLTQVAYDEDGFSTAKPIAATFKLGAGLSPNLAIEGRLGTGLTDDEASGCVAGVGCGSPEIEVDYYYGVYLKGMLPTGTVSPYALIGYTKGELTASLGGFSLSADDSDVSFGLGIDVPISRTAGLNVEYAQLIDGEGFEVTALSAGVTWRY